MQIKITQITLIVFTFFAAQGALAPNSYAMQHLTGDKAMQYVGEAKPKFTGGGYTYEVLKRSHRDSLNGRFSDAVIFNPGGSLFLYIKRTDGDHDLIINHPDGRQEDPVTAEPHVWNPLENTLGDDHPKPNVFLDDNGNEMAVVYIGGKTRLTGKLTDDGLLRLRIRVKQVVKRRGRKSGARI